MGTTKKLTRKATGNAREVVAEIIGDGNRREKSKPEQRDAEKAGQEESESGAADLNPFGNLNRLT